MSSAEKKPCRVVFIGNIPYDLSETQIVEIFSEVGPVVSFRMVFDRDSGKPKGYGFCTFPDADTAASAVRNLHNYDVGGRQLRVDFADQDDVVNDNLTKKDAAQGRAVVKNPGALVGQYPPPPPSQGHGIGMLAPQKPMPGTAESVQAAMANMGPQQLLEYLSYLKLFAMQTPDQCRLLLQQNPQLVYALFQALVVMNVVDSTVMQQIIASQVPQQQQQQMMPGIMMPPQPPLMTMQQQPPPPMMIPQQQQQQPMPPVDIQEQQKQLLMQVLQLTPEQIQALPPDQQRQVLDLRAQIMGQQ